MGERHTSSHARYHSGTSSSGRPLNLPKGTTSDVGWPAAGEGLGCAAGPCESVTAGFGGEGGASCGTDGGVAGDGNSDGEPTLGMIGG